MKENQAFWAGGRFEADNSKDKGLLNQGSMSWWVRLMRWYPGVFDWMKQDHRLFSSKRSEK